MKVFNLRCSQDHGFEGWFPSEGDCVAQTAQGQIDCPLCGDNDVRRVPSAPRLNLSGAAERATASAPEDGDGAGGERQARWLHAMRSLLARTEDVGERFAEEARRIHYGEAAERGIRGRASPEEAKALAEEGIDVLPLPVPPGLEGPLQ